MVFHKTCFFNFNENIGTYSLTESSLNKMSGDVIPGTPKYINNIIHRLKFIALGMSFVIESKKYLQIEKIFLTDS